MTENPATPEPTPDSDEQNDEIIGQAFQQSVKFIGIVALVSLITWIGINFEPTSEPIEKGPEVPVRPRGVNETNQHPPLPFTNVGKASGFEFDHEDGARGKKLLPETMGSGCAFVDVDGDGDSDILMASGRPWEWTDETAPESTLRLWINDGTGQFTEQTEQWNLKVKAYCTGLAIGDVDSDGDQDVFVAAVGPDLLLINSGNRFSNSAKAGVSGTESAWSSSAGFFDAEGDGDLDLFVCQYVQWSPEKDLEVDYRLTGVGRAYGPPTNFEGSPCRLYLNNGQGQFTDVSREAGLQTPELSRATKALALLTTDIDKDGDIDVVVANDTTRNFVFKNNGDAVFEEIGVECGLAYDSNGSATGAMGLDLGDYRNDGGMGIAVANFSAEMTGLYRSMPSSGLFIDESVNEGVGPPSRKALSFGLLFLDVDLDGRQDLVQANGHLEEKISTVQPGQEYRQQAQLFWNRGPGAGCFVEVPAAELADLSKPAIGRALACADIDGDGDLDLLLTQVGEPARLLRNDQMTGHHWIRIKTSNISPGSWIECKRGEEVQRQMVGTTRSYLSQCEAVVTFGLGSNSEIPTITIQEQGKTPVRFKPNNIDSLIAPPSK
ncbi:MAG: hypothetical protein CBC13_10375 [Planctomycetia bacterium TMED53]|nr:MAG: hypothetical protein CBC13_10375 [Planctomycetia bacterium TMED53]